MEHKFEECADCGSTGHDTGSDTCPGPAEIINGNDVMIKCILCGNPAERALSDLCIDCDNSHEHRSVLSSDGFSAYCDICGTTLE